MPIKISKMIKNVKLCNIFMICRPNMGIIIYVRLNIVSVDRDDDRLHLANGNQY